MVSAARIAPPSWPGRERFHRRHATPAGLNEPGVQFGPCSRGTGPDNQPILVPLHPSSRVGRGPGCGWLHEQPRKRPGRGVGGLPSTQPGLAGACPRRRCGAVLAGPALASHRSAAWRRLAGRCRRPVPSRAPLAMPRACSVGQLRAATRSPGAARIGHQVFMSCPAVEMAPNLKCPRPQGCSSASGLRCRNAMNSFCTLGIMPRPGQHELLHGALGIEAIFARQRRSGHHACSGPHRGRTRGGLGKAHHGSGSFVRSSGQCC